MSPKLTELINAYYNAVSVNVAEARVALETEISRIVAELEFCREMTGFDGDEVMSKSALQLILDIAEGSATVNSFPHIAKIARKALDEANTVFNHANIVAALKMPGNSSIKFEAADLIEAQAAHLDVAQTEIARLKADETAVMKQLAAAKAETGEVALLMLQRINRVVLLEAQLDAANAEIERWKTSYEQSEANAKILVRQRNERGFELDTTKAALRAAKAEIDRLKEAKS